MLTYYEMLEKNTKILNTYTVHSIWKFNAFTCFVALIISWGKISGSRRCVLRPVGALEDRFLVIGILPCVF